MPFFSVVIPVYNKQAHIRATITSVLLQEEKDYEIIIVNDGSTDESKKIILEFDDPKIRCFSTENKGVSKARNLGIQKAKGELIAFLDADDYWYPNHLEILGKLYKKFPDAGLYTTSYEKRFTAKINFPAQFKHIDSGSNSLMIIDDFFEASTIDPIAWTSACAVPKTVIQMLGGFDTSITHGAGEDTDLWIRIALKFPIALATFITAIYTLDANNRVSKINPTKRNFMNMDTYKEAEQSNPSLKKYLDQNRYAISILYKMAGDHNVSKKYRAELNTNNLTYKQKIILTLPRSILLLLKNIKNQLLTRFHIKLSAFD